LEHLRCVVERITYQNQENGYSVIKCKAKGFADLVTVIGNMPDVHVGSVLSLGGSWRVDKKYGRQFSVETFEETLPATVYGIEKYLGSGLIKGIGPKFAKQIVNKFKEQTLEVIENEPDLLIDVQGIGKIRVERIRKSWAEQKEIKNIMLFLQSHDVSTSHATRIFKTYGNESIKVVQDNPYRLADDIWGIGFKTADTIASKMGFGHEKYVRLRRGGYTYRQNDKVMQIRNNYDKEVFNGDIGVITFVDLEDRSLKVDFDSREVEYDVTELDELVLAYATTIHKSQGSEYPIVVMPVTMNHFVMLQRNLIYTGITRAKKIMVIVGTKKALVYAVKNVTVTDRNTMLKERIQELLPDGNAFSFSVQEAAKDPVTYNMDNAAEISMVAEPAAGAVSYILRL